MGYIVATSLTHRTAPAFAPTAETRVRAPGWERAGDTITVDATDGDRWRYVSLAQGRVLPLPDTAGWDVAIRRYHLRASAGAADLGVALFDTVHGVSTAPSDTGALDRWYRYSLVTHLLEPNGHVYVAQDGSGRAFKLQVLSYYCPGLTAGCMTLRYASLPAGAVGRQSSRTP